VFELLRCFGAGNIYSIRPGDGEVEADNGDAGDWPPVLVSGVTGGEDVK
jgi:hypothetical protein